MTKARVFNRDGREVQVFIPQRTSIEITYEDETTEVRRFDTLETALSFCNILDEEYASGRVIAYEVIS